MPLKDDLAAWRALLLTSRTGKISQTALSMDLTTSKVSRLLIGLEEELGYPLFDKTRRPLYPTERCRQLLAVLEPILKDFQYIQEPTFGIEGRSLIRVGAPVEASLDFYCFDYARFWEENPGVEFEILPEVSERDVRDRKVDVAMLNHMPEDASEFKIRPVATTTTFPMATPEYLRRFGTPKTLADLANHRGLLLKTHTFPVTRFLQKQDQTSSVLQWKSVFYTHDQFMLKKLVLNHWGITVDLYGGHVLAELERGELVPVLEGWSRPPWNMCVVTCQDVEMANQDIARFAAWWSEHQNYEDNVRMTHSRELIEKFRRSAGQEKKGF